LMLLMQMLLLVTTRDDVAADIVDVAFIEAVLDATAIVDDVTAAIDDMFFFVDRVPHLMRTMRAAVATLCYTSPHATAFGSRAP
jgi:hypothetical protein